MCLSYKYKILEKKAHLVPNIRVHNPGHTRWRRASLCPNDSFLFKNLSNPNPEGKNGNLLEIGNPAKTQTLFFACSSFLERSVDKFDTMKNSYRICI